MQSFPDGPDHRQNAGPDRLGQFGPGGHDGVAQLPRSLISSNSSASHCLGRFACTISISRCLHSSASRFHSPTIRARSELGDQDRSWVESVIEERLPGTLALQPRLLVQVEVELLLGFREDLVAPALYSMRGRKHLLE